MSNCPLDPHRIPTNAVVLLTNDESHPVAVQSSKHILECRTVEGIATARDALAEPADNPHAMRFRPSAYSRLLALVPVSIFCGLSGTRYPNVAECPHWILLFHVTHLRIQQIKLQHKSLTIC